MHTRGVVRRPLLLLAVAATSVGLAGAPALAADGPRAEARRIHPIGVRSETLVDPARPTAATPALDLAASPSRTIPVTVWYPSTGAFRAEPVPDAPMLRDRRFPLIVWAHGNGARGTNAPSIVRAWASLGYVVVAPDFPASSRARTNLDAIDDWNAQPGDVRFVIDQMLHGKGIGGLGKLVDRRRVGVAGHSLGAMTALTAGFGAHADPRIDAVMTFAGIPLLDGTDVGSRRIPLFLFHGNDDPTVPAAQSREMFDRATGPRYLLTVAGGGHSAYLQAPDPETAKTLATASVAFWDHTLRRTGDPAARIAALATPGRFTVQVGGSPDPHTTTTRR